MMNPATDLKRTVIFNALRRCRLFEGLRLTDLSAVTDIAVIKRLEKRQTLFREGMPVQGFFVVQSGAVTLRKLGVRGHEHVTHVFREPECFAEDMLLSETGYWADACAADPSQVLMIHKAPFIALLKQQSELSLRLLGSVSDHVSRLMKSLSDITSKDVETRLGDWLLERCPDPASSNPQRIQLPITKRLLASELGIRGETLSRAFNKLRHRDLLAVRGRTIILRCPVRLTQWLNPLEAETAA